MAVEAERPLAVEALQPLVADQRLEPGLALLRFLCASGLGEQVMGVGDKAVQGRHAKDQRRRLRRIVGRPGRGRKGQQGEEVNGAHVHEQTPFQFDPLPNGETGFPSSLPRQTAGSVTAFSARPAPKRSERWLQ